MNISEKIIRAKADCDAVYEAGKQAEYDAFWDNFQDYGNRQAYIGAFSYTAWNDTNFKPKYDIKIVGSGSNIFHNSKIIDLEATLERAGIVLDTSQATNLNNAFSNRYTKVLPVIDMSSITNATSANINIQPEMVTIRKIICKESMPWANACFRYASGLVNLVIEGTIGSNGCNLQYSTNLSRDSIISIINALSDNTSDLTVAFSLSAVNKAFETSEGTNDGSASAEWQALIVTKPNWTIELA